MQKEKFHNDLFNLVSRIRLSEPLEIGWKMQYHISKVWEMCHFDQMHILVTGSGNNYPAALFAKHSCADSFRTANVEAICTQDAIKKFKQFKHIVNCDYHVEYDVVIIISYEGPTNDVRKIYDECMMSSSKPEIVILTGQREDCFDSKIYQNAKIFSYYYPEVLSGTEVSSVSSFSTFISCAIFDDFQSSIPSTEDNVEALMKSMEEAAKMDMNKIAYSIFMTPVVYVICEWDTMSVAYDIKNKFEKAGLAFVNICNKREFSQNADMWLSKTPGLIINLMRYQFAIQMDTKKAVNLDKTDYETALKNFVKCYAEENCIPYLEIGSPAMMPMQCCMESMAMFLYVFAGIWNAYTAYENPEGIPLVNMELFDKMQSYEGDF